MGKQFSQWFVLSLYLYFSFTMPSLGKFLPILRNLFKQSKIMLDWPDTHWDSLEVGIKLVSVQRSKSWSYTFPIEILGNARHHAKSGL